MSAYPMLAHSGVQAHHVAQLYGDDDRALIRQVARYLGEGMTQGDGLLVVASLDRIESFARALRRYPGYLEALEYGRLVLLDAATTLEQVLGGGEPQWDRFKRIVGTPLSQLQQRIGRSQVRIYGEMVDLLWRAGRYPTAVLLEEYWNRLLAASDCRLFCAYPIDIFAPALDRATVAPLLCTHSHMVPLTSVQERAVARAVRDVLGADALLEPPAAAAHDGMGHAAIPKALATLFWVKDRFPDEAVLVLDRARQYARPTSTR